MTRISKSDLNIDRLTAGPKGKVILNKLNLLAKPGTITALMGPNGSGKSTLANILMGHPDYQVKSGRIMWQGVNILKLDASERAKLGVFLAFQYPIEISGVGYREFLWTAYQAVSGKKASTEKFEHRLHAALRELKLSPKFLERSINEGFSGGEKKKAELLQLLMLQPKLIILDETDSGLDIDALKLVARTVKKLISPQRVILVITHYQKLLRALKPDAVHVMSEGMIAVSGGQGLIHKLDRQGYAWLLDKK
jgi:Fe-S cluster assembly ATP-binding protein